MLALGTKFTGSNLFYKGRLKQLHTIVARLFYGKLPFALEGSRSVAPFWFKGDTGEVVFLYNFGFDKQKFTLYAKNNAFAVEMEPLTIKEFNL